MLSISLVLILMIMSTARRRLVVMDVFRTYSPVSLLRLLTRTAKNINGQLRGTYGKESFVVSSDVRPELVFQYVKVTVVLRLFARLFIRGLAVQ